MATKKYQKLMLVGDSMIEFFDWQGRFPEREVINLGRSGESVEELRSRAISIVDRYEAPDLVLVMIGTNNTGHRQDPPEQTAAGVKAIVEQLRERLPKTKVLLLAIFPRGADANDRLRKINDATNEIIAKYADGKNVFFLDISDTFLEDDGTLPKSIMPDLLHPNPEGYGLWAEAMEPMIKKLMGEK